MGAGEEKEVPFTTGGVGFGAGGERTEVKTTGLADAAGAAARGRGLAAAEGASVRVPAWGWLGADACEMVGILSLTFVEFSGGVYAGTEKGAGRSDIS